MTYDLYVIEGSYSDSVDIIVGSAVNSDKSILSYTITGLEASTTYSYIVVVTDSDNIQKQYVLGRTDTSESTAAYVGTWYNTDRTYTFTEDTFVISYYDAGNLIDFHATVAVDGIQLTAEQHSVFVNGVYYSDITETMVWDWYIESGVLKLKGASGYLLYPDTASIPATIAADVFEVDSYVSDSKVIVEGEVMYHTLHGAEEEDWIKFDHTAGSYTFTTSVGTVATDTYMEVYSDGQNILVSDNDSGDGVYSSITYNFLLLLHVILLSVIFTIIMLVVIII